MNIAVLFTSASLLSVVWAKSFSIDYDRHTFIRDGEPFRYVSGSIHYQRLPAEYWEDRLYKMYAGGLNAIQTYIFWNQHAPEARGQYNFDGSNDIESFLQLVQKQGLLAIIRVGPYVCAEEEFGGLPWWLFQSNKKITLRSTDPDYLSAVDEWLNVILNKLKPYLYENGGPIIMLQMENEYGSYPTCQQDYLTHLYDQFRGVLGNNSIIFTTDGASEHYLKCGAFPKAYTTVDFGPGANLTSTFGSQKLYNNGGPLVNSEYYTGWLDHWGAKHSQTATGAVTKTLDEMLALGANVNMYMFFGGTNFGFWNGANAGGNGNGYSAQPTSYDYDSPISEAGDIGNKWLGIRSVISKYRSIPDVPLPKNSTKAAFGYINVKKIGMFDDILPRITKDFSKSKYPINSEALKQGYGYTYYETFITQDYGKALIDTSSVRDRAQLFLNNTLVGVVYRGGPKNMNITFLKGQKLGILVENMGRINYGPSMDLNRKGIVGNISISNEVLTDWTIYNIDVSLALLMDPVSTQTRETRGASLWRGSFYVERTADTFVKFNQWNKGQLYVNGHHLGRYWPVAGPQMTLYVPGTLLKHGQNEVVVWETDAAPEICSSGSCQVMSVSAPVLNGPVNPPRGSDKPRTDRASVYNNDEQ